MDRFPPMNILKKVSFSFYEFIVREFPLVGIYLPKTLYKYITNLFKKCKSNHKYEHAEIRNYDLTLEYTKWSIVIIYSEIYTSLIEQRFYLWKPPTMLKEKQFITSNICILGCLAKYKATY